VRLPRNGGAALTKGFPNYANQREYHEAFFLCSPATDAWSGCKGTPVHSSPPSRLFASFADKTNLMKAKFRTVPGSIVAPKGFLASGVFCNIKRLGTGKGSAKGRKRDLALIVSEVPATVAGMFTTNQICAAPVKVSIQRVKKGVAQAIVVNSGNANACTGKQGLRDAFTLTALVAKALHMPAEQVLVGSTGRIGVMLPMDNLKRGILDAVTLLGDAPECADHAAEAIITSDTRRKQIAVAFKLSEKPVCMGGICKGAGMIQPGLSATGRRPAAMPGRASRGAPNGGGPHRHATMLCFITTDAAIEA